ncbi:MAG: ATP-binding protein [Lachnospiraceae bacterium]|nr:ATP-binding protein [Lachnospiraceae bacterium]
MALTNTQYNDIMREYDELRTQARHTQEQHHRHVVATIPEYAALEDQVSSFAGNYTQRIIQGDASAQDELAKEMQSIRSRKAALLAQHGLPADYLALQYRCPDCLDTGYVEGKKCHCFRQREISILYSQSHLEDVLEKENFDTLSYNVIAPECLSSYGKTVEICKQYALDFDKEPKSLLFTGTVGTGKTFLSNCIAKALLDSYHSVLYFSAVDLFQNLSQAVFSKDKDGLYSFYEDLYNCDLVIIDDLGTELANSFVGSQLFSLINERQLRSKAILISTNLGLGELTDRYGERVVSRIVSNFTTLEITGPDIRISRKTNK